MILVDTCVWVDHLRSGDFFLYDLLQREQVLIHPVVIGELVLGGLDPAGRKLADLLDLPAGTVADDEETLRLIRQQRLAGCGIGYADACLLASTRLTNGASLWTRDLRLRAAAERLGLATRIEAGPGMQE